MKLINSTCFLLLFLFVPFLHSQNQVPSELFDEIIAIENTDLASGTEYIEQHIIRNNKHKYLESVRFEPGKLTYDGQTFLDIPMKYNIYDDLLLINLINSGGASTVLLHKEKIDSFSLYGHNFLNLKVPKEESEIEGFYEILLEIPDGLLLKKHVKKILKHLDKNFTYYEFETDEPVYVIFQDNVYTPFDSRSDLTKLFPAKEKLIREFYRSNRSLSKKNKDQFYINLLKVIQSRTSIN